MLQGLWGVRGGSGGWGAGWGEGDVAPWDIADFFFCEPSTDPPGPVGAVIKNMEMVPYSGAYRLNSARIPIFGRGFRGHRNKSAGSESHKLWAVS